MVHNFYKWMRDQDETVNGCERVKRCLEKDDLCDYCEWKLDQEAGNDWLYGSEEIESFYYNTQEKGETEYESDMPF